LKAGKLYNLVKFSSQSYTTNETQLRNTSKTCFKTS